MPNPAEEARHARLFDRIRLWGREDMPEKVREEGEEGQVATTICYSY